jgi:hypothetical protein
MVMIVFGISFLYRSIKNTLTTSLIILLAFSVPALFSTTLKSNTFAQVFGKINPINNIFESLDNVLVDYQLSLLSNWQFIYPLLLFCVLGLILMIISARRFQDKGIISND